MHVLAINIGDQTCASSYYRIWQFQAPLHEAGIQLEAVSAAEFDGRRPVQDYDCLIIQKKLFSLGKVRAFRRAAKMLVFDLDDAVWAEHRRKRGRIRRQLMRWRVNRRLKAICRCADICTVANEVIAAKLREWGAHVEIVPMALDESVWRPRDRENAGNRVRVGWAGAPGNLKYLRAIAPALVEVQREFPEIEIAVYCGNDPKFDHGLRYKHIPYRGGDEPAVIRGFDIGLAPLPDKEFAQGKSPIKCLQYMASGVAPVVSPVGATRSMFVEGHTALFARAQEEWAAALKRLITDTKLRRRISENARFDFEKNYSLAHRVPLLASILQNRSAARQLLASLNENRPDQAPLPA